MVSDIGSKNQIADNLQPIIVPIKQRSLQIAVIQSYRLTDCRDEAS
jgi:hypothetical protein